MTTKRTSILLVIVFLCATGAQAVEHSTQLLLARAWPAAPYAELGDIGAGVGIIFSPDLSVPGNCRFYQALGFACFDDADWTEVLNGVRDYNAANPRRPIRTLVLETHGTNGNGLKLQTGKTAEADRSYISVGALQELTEPYGVRYVMISACNSGRLLRPEIYRRLDPNKGDKLFLPASKGIIGASDDFNPRRSRITVITPASSQIETTLVGSIREMAPSTREALMKVAKEKNLILPRQFAISEMLIQMLLRDPTLELHTGGPWVEELSRVQTSPEGSERLFDAFVAHLNYIAAREATAPTASASAAVR
ncbi:MAG: hypothetical protein QOH21_1294 [Acidobacteriota bacterium]|jgi:hypothetical protein|nr:hypothetical protein [Acidobacteriota bacterium]